MSAIPRCDHLKPPTGRDDRTRRFRLRLRPRLGPPDHRGRQDHHDCGASRQGQGDFCFATGGALCPTSVRRPDAVLTLLFEPDSLGLDAKIEHYRGDAWIRLPGDTEIQERLFVFMKYAEGSELEKTTGYRTNIQTSGRDLMSKTAVAENAHVRAHN